MVEEKCGDAEADAPATRSSRVLTAYWDMAVGTANASECESANVFIAPSSGASVLDYGHMIRQVDYMLRHRRLIPLHSFRWKPTSRRPFPTRYFSLNRFPSTS